MHTVKLFQVLLCNTNNSISVISFHTVKWFNSSILSIDGTLTGTTSLGESGHASNGNEEVLHIPQSSRTGAPTSDHLDSYTGHSLGRSSSL